MKEVVIKRALISVSNKQGVVLFAKKLHELGIEIISTGGTSRMLQDANIPIIEVSELTGFPEMMDGRLKTLHPKIHGGILGRRALDTDVAKAQGINWIDLVVVNLYPFEETIQRPNVTFAQAIENIDIGGPTMIRAAAKNMDDVAVVVYPSDYDEIIQQLSNDCRINAVERRALAIKAFEYTAHYDAVIHEYLSSAEIDQTLFPDKIQLSLNKTQELRYGENPNQSACAYQLGSKLQGVFRAVQHQGKALSYNNLVDADAAITCVKEFEMPSCVIVKHANPCGVASASSICEAFNHAYETDGISAFGGIIALNRACDAETARVISTLFFEVLIAPKFSKDALTILTAKPNLRVLELAEMKEPNGWEYKWIEGGVLVQARDQQIIQLKAHQVVTVQKPSQEVLDDLLFAWQIVKHVKSNAILIAKDFRAIGIGAGQVSRIDAVDIAIRKASNRLDASVLASDAFFPFRDSIDRIANTGIKAIIQPGGSLRDQEVIDACNEYGIIMLMSGIRCFKH